MTQPLLSIVIVNYNYGRFLETAIKSIVNQEDFNKCELIVVDGGSTDKSVEIIKKYANGLPPNTSRAEWPDDSKLQTLNSKLISWWCSEKDNGQSDAFNKGFAHARGKFGCWLNADDLMTPKAISLIVSYIKRHPDAMWIAGSCIFVDNDLRIKWCSRCVHVWGNGFTKTPMYAVNGPSSFFSLEKLRSLGGFDESLRYTMDIDLWRRFAQDGMLLHHVKSYVWVFRVHQESKTSHIFLTGKRRSDCFVEAREVDIRYGITYKLARIGGYINRLIRLVSGTYLWSWIDTRRFKGKNIVDVFPLFSNN